MHPVLFEIGGHPVTSFAVMLVLALVVGGGVAGLEMRRLGWDPTMAVDALILGGTAGVIGARLHQALFAPDDFQAGPIRFLLSSGSGLAFYGGLIAGALTVAAWVRWKGLPLGTSADIAAVAIPLGYGVGRIGCLLVGDDYGIPTGLPWGMTFPEGSPATTTPVHPTQIYESAAALAIFGIVWRLRRWDRRAGALFGLSIGLLGLERLLVEFVRRNPAVALGLTWPQWISAGLIVAGGILSGRASATRSLRRRAPGPSR